MGVNDLARVAYSGNIQGVERLLGVKKMNINSTGGSYGSALGAAAFRGNKEMASLLLDRGADVNITGGDYGSALGAAAYRGEKEMASLLLDRGADVNITGGDYGSALGTAVYRGNKGVVSLLLDRGADVNGTSGRCVPPLVIAAHSTFAGSPNSNQNAIVSLLLDGGADVNSTCGDCGSALAAAARRGNMEIVLLLLNRGADVNSSGGGHGSALGAAAYGAGEEVVSLLLDRGADVNTKGGKYGSPLGTAARRGNKEIVSLLLNRGADVNSSGGDHGSALGAAVYRGSQEIVSILLNRGADANSTGGNYGSALGAACSWGRKGILSLLLDRGADVNRPGGDYGSALGAAAYGAREDVVSLLLERGADVNSTGGKYGSALGAAAYRGKGEAVSLLLDRGADVNRIGGDYGSALGAAAHGAGEEVVSLLLDRGADVNSTGGKYGSALGAAANWGKVEAVSLLLDRGADVNRIGGDYGSALGAAVYQGSEEIVSLLLDRGADVNRACTGDGYGSPLAAAAASGKWGMVSLLLSRGANVNIVGGKYGTALIAAAYHGHENIMSLLITRRADVNAITCTGQYGTALAAAALQGNATAVSLLLGRRANTNIVCGEYGTALAAASYNGHTDIMSKLLEYPGTDINAIGGHYGTALGAAFAGTSSSHTTKLLLEHGADIDLVDCMYGSLLGKAAYKGEREFVSLLLAHGADAFHVGGEYETVTGEYPTALDAARAGRANVDTVTLLSRTMNDPVQIRDTTPWPPFPMPFRGSLAAMQVSGEAPLASTVSSPHGYLEIIVSTQSRTGMWDGNLTPGQADLPCKAIDEELLRMALVALVGIHNEAAERLQVWIRNDVRYLVNLGYDLGLAYAAARVAWKSFNDPDFNIAAHRGQWLAEAKRIDAVRETAVYTDDTGQALIKSPYRIMPRRIWDLKSNRVVEFRMLHSEVLAREYVSDLETASPTFWAITHSWTNEMSPVTTSINQYQWPTPLPRGLDLDHGVRQELLHKGAEYVWLDVLCLRQHSTANDHTKEDEWKLDVPTIGNIYRAAVGIARYFNGLGQTFSTKGWDHPRHWLGRAWTLQEIRSENTTYNAGILRKTSAHIIMKTQSRVGGKVTTLRQALDPVVKLAAQVDSPSGCSVYELVQQMAKRHATQPTDKVAGLFYLLRTTQLPTYDSGISAVDAWAKCFHVLPFERKIEILFDFPYAGDSDSVGDLGYSTSHDCQWFPTWRQLMEWPDRDPSYDHTVAVWPQNQAHLQIAQKPDHLFVPDIWAISDVCLCRTSEENEYEIDVGNEIFGFYYPYVHQKPIEMSRCERYTLVTTHPDHSYNWVVCESLGKRDEWYTTLDGAIKAAEIEHLRKLGVLRTDSCSELVLGMGRRNSILKKINALVV